MKADFTISLSKGASGNGSSHSSIHGTRLTRSRANQGTPGPNDQGNDSPSKIKISIFEASRTLILIQSFFT